MLTFKLSRRGKKGQPTYRLLVLDKRRDPWGKFKEDVGSYNPHTKKAQFKIERIKYWLSCGAQPSATVHNLFVREKILDTAKKKIKMKKKPVTEEKAAPIPSAPATETPKTEAPAAKNPAPEPPSTPSTESAGTVEKKEGIKP